jgi:hypothetical protein
MSNYIIRLALLFAAAGLFSCKKKFDDYYARPASLEPPIYQQLETKGNFTQFLSLIDKAGYKQTLNSAGYWTIFAPSDSAFTADLEFKAYLTARGFSSVSAVDSVTAQSLVQYLLVFNAFNKDRLDDYQSNLGWVTDAAFKRRTAYYTGFYKDTTFAGQALQAVASNRNNSGTGTGYYISSDNNNKYLPFFTTGFFTTKALTTADYNYFYPTASFSGFNIGNAKVTQQDIAAENGVIHVIDHVVTPLFSLDQYLRSRPEYSEFRKIFEKFMVQFVQNADASHRYQVLSGSSDNVYVKVYSNLLAYALNNENYFKLQDNDGQRDGWTLFAPKNDSLLSYINRIEKEGYGNINNFPINIIADLLNSHMWQSSLWPSKFNSTYNFLGEPAHIDAQADVFDRKILSNGFFYGTSKVNEPNAFSTVYGKSYLNPKFSIMTRLLDMELKGIVTNPSPKYVMFMMPDAVLAANSYGYNGGLNTWTLGSVTNDSIRLNLMRILNTSIVESTTSQVNTFTNMVPSDSGTVVTYGSEYIKFKYNAAAGAKIQVITAGTKDRNLTVLADSIKTTKNGVVVYLNNLLHFTYIPSGKHIESLGSPATSEYNLFWNYLKNSTIYDAVAGNILNTQSGSFYTIFIPNNNAIRAAITAGLLPGTSATPNFTPTAIADQALVEKFLLYHMLDKRTVSNDGKDIGAFPTLLKNALGDAVSINLLYPGGVFELGDAFGRKAHLVPGQANNLSNRTLIHLIDNYLKY